MSRKILVLMQTVVLHLNVVLTASVLFVTVPWCRSDKQQEEYNEDTHKSSRDVELAVYVKCRPMPIALLCSTDMMLMLMLVLVL